MYGIRDPRSRLDQHPAERGQPLEAVGKPRERFAFSFLLPVGVAHTKRGISIIDPMRKH